MTKTQLTFLRGTPGSGVRRLGVRVMVALGADLFQQESTP